MEHSLLKQLSVITEEEKEILAGRDGINRSLYMADNSHEIDHGLLLEKGKLITLRPHTRFVYFPKHTHNYMEMIYMCKGKTRHRINGIDLLLQEGEILLLSQNAVQEVFPAGEDDVGVNFIIWPQFFDTTLKILGEEDNQIRDFLVNCLKSKNAGTGYLHFKVSDVLPIQNLVENLIWTLTSEGANKRRISPWTMGLLFLQLVNHTENLYTDPRFSEQQLMLRVLRYIEEHYCDGELRDLAAELHYDMTWLSREIKKQSGKTFTELMQDRRMNQAVFLLKTTKMNVAEISESIGYENFSYFHQLFKKRYGTSPHKYRHANNDSFLINPPSFFP